MLVLGIIGVVFLMIGLLSFVITCVSGIKHAEDILLEVIVSTIGAVCLYLSIVL